MLLVLAGCPSKPTPATTTPASPTEKSGDAVAGDDSRMSPDDYPARKLQVLRTPSELSWVDAPQAKGVATAGAWGDPSKEGGWFIKLAQGSATQQTYEVDARGIVVTGTIEPSTPPSPNVRIAALRPARRGRSRPAFRGRSSARPVRACVFVEIDGRQGRRHREREARVRAVVGTGRSEQAERVAGRTGLGRHEDGAERDADEDPRRQPGVLAHPRFDYYAVVLDGILDNIESGHEREGPAGRFVHLSAGWQQAHANCKAGGAECMVYTHFLGAYDIKAM